MLRHLPNNAGDRKPIVTMEALEEYQECIAKLCKDFPECWSLVMKAEDRCRGEHFERIRRFLIRARLEGRLPMNLNFDPDQPWPSVFTFAARDEAYWTAEVIRPAQIFLIRGGTGRRMLNNDAEETVVPEGAARPWLPSGLHTALQDKANPRLQSADGGIKSGLMRQMRQLWSRSAILGFKGRFERIWQRSGPPANSSSQIGMVVKFCVIGSQKASRQPGACSEPCPDERSHCCQLCLGQHPNCSCPSQGKGSGKDGKRSK